MRWDDELRATRVIWRGQQFDSQLEADWAATFDAWGMEYVYHPGRLFLGGGVVWEPDFQLDEDVIFEVKGAGNNRIEKAWQAASEGYNVIIGRSSWLPAGSDVETAGAVWEPENWVVRNVGSRLVFVDTDQSEAKAGDSYSAMFAFARSLEGIRSFKAVGDKQAV